MIWHAIQIRHPIIIEQPAVMMDPLEVRAIRHISLIGPVDPYKMVIMVAADKSAGLAIRTEEIEHEYRIDAVIHEITSEGH